MSENEYIKIKSISDRWIDWNPLDKESIILKKAIDNTESKFNNKT